MTAARSRTLAFLALAFVVSAIVVAVPRPAHAMIDKDCADFDTQRQAQRFFENHDPGRDPHRLDEDGDMVACETLPCPCDLDGPAPQPPHQPAVQRDRGRVVAVSDGDTLRVKIDGREKRVRILGIDTPEVFSGEECGGAQASRSAKKLLHPGDKVILRSDPTQALRDQYGRLLRYVSHDGTDIGKTQVQRGWAKVYVFDDSFQRVTSYRDAQHSAKHKDRGAWDLCDGHFHQAL